MTQFLSRFSSSAGRADAADSAPSPRRKRHLALLATASIAVGCVGFAGVGPAAAVPMGALVEVPAESSGLSASVDDVTTSTTLTPVLLPTRYGDIAFFTATTTVDGPVNPLTMTVEFVLDGTVSVSGPMLYVGSGKFAALLPYVPKLNAGTHTIVARFPGSEGVAGSDSEALTVTVAQAPTSTTITSAPSTVTAFTPVEVRAQVTSGVEGLNGSAELLADGTPIATGQLSSTGEVVFSGVEVPWGATGLTVAYVGGPDGNWANSTSEVSPISVDALGTSAELTLSSQRIRAIDTVTASVEVRVNDSGLQVDPRGGVEILIDGDPVYTEVSSDDHDAATGDGVTRFDVELGGLAVGGQVVTARYLPAPGFGEAETQPVDLTVGAVETAIAVSASDVRGTPAHPARVSVTTELIESDSDGEGPRTDGNPARTLMRADASDALATPVSPFAPSGTVQTLVEGEPFGEPFAVLDGAGSGLLAGLPVGTHEVELRFVPDTQGLLPSSTFVTATIVADPGPDTDGGGKDGSEPAGGKAPAGRDGGKLAASGSELQNGALLGGAALLLGAGAVLSIARQRRRS